MEVGVENGGGDLWASWFWFCFAYPCSHSLIALVSAPYLSEASFSYCHCCFSSKDTFVFPWCAYRQFSVPSATLVRFVNIFFFLLGQGLTAQAGLEHTIQFPLPPTCWDYRCVPPFPALIYVLLLAHFALIKLFWKMVSMRCAFNLKVSWIERNILL